MEICLHCNKQLNCTSVFSKGGHLGRCPAYKAIRDSEIEYAMNEDIDHEPIYDLQQIDFNDVPSRAGVLSNEDATDLIVLMKPFTVI